MKRILLLAISLLTLSISAQDAPQLAKKMISSMDKNAKNDALLEACKNGKSDAVKVLLENRADVNARDMNLEKINASNAIYAQPGFPEPYYLKGGFTPLMYASQNGFTDIVTLLIQHGANVNEKEIYKIVNSYGSSVDMSNPKTAIMLAYDNNHPEIVDILRAAGAIDPQHDSHELGKAAAANDIEKVKKLLPKASVAEKNKALVEAAKNANMPLITILLDRGANKDGINAALVETSRIGNIALITFFLSKNADQNARNNALLEASKKGNIESIQLLVNTADQQAKSSALWNATKANKLDAVKILLDNGANINHSQFNNGETPLIVAVANNNIELVKLLLDRGADTSIRSGIRVKKYPTSLDLISPTAFDIANGNGYKEIIELLAQASNNLSQAVDSGNIELVKNMMPKITQAGKNDALVEASKKNNIEMVKLLLDNGAHINAQAPVLSLLISRTSHGGAKVYSNQGGETPLIFAVKNNNIALVILLLAQRADSSIKAPIQTPYGQEQKYQTALDIAKEKGFTEIIELLQKNRHQINKKVIKKGAR